MENLNLNNRHGNILELTHQTKAVKDILATGFPHDIPGCMLVAKTGSGKTYMICRLIQQLEKENWFSKRRIESGSMTPFNVLWLTKAPAVMQTKKVANLDFGIKNIFVTNYEQLRTSFGALFIREVVVVDDWGKERVEYRWNELFTPLLIIVDECQVLKNSSSIRSKQFQGLLESFTTEKAPRILPMSATPFGRVSDAKAVICSLRPTHRFGWQGTVEITTDHWRDFSQVISSPSPPEAYNRAAVGRLMDKISDRVVRVTGERQKYHAHNKLKIMPFVCEKDRLTYQRAKEAYQAMMIRIKRMDRYEKAGLYIVQLTIYNKACEVIKAPYFAMLAHDAILAGKAPVVGVKYKITIMLIVKCLIEKYGHKREDIAILFGGITPNDIEKDPRLAEGIEKYNLKPMSKERRHNEEVLPFQNDDKIACLLTLATGGSCLSLHHERAETKTRTGFFSICYSDMDIVQYMGRAHRFTSFSDTDQYIILFDNTLETSHISPIIQRKLNSLGKVMGSTESWTSALVEDLETKKVIDLEESKKNTKLLEDSVQDMYVETEAIEKKEIITI